MVERHSSSEQSVLLEKQITTGMWGVVSELAEKWENPNVGIAGAGVLLPSGVLAATATSLFNDREKKWWHAEALALDVYRRTYMQNPPLDSIMLCILLPCAEPEQPLRIGRSCIDLINMHQMPVVCCSIDSNQLNQPENSNSRLFVVNDLGLQLVGKYLTGLFELQANWQAQQDHPGKNPWPELKKQLPPLGDILRAIRQMNEHQAANLLQADSQELI
ncbi:MAG: hypothetical protein GF381_04340, partial [Candidatus Pacebacteria bacterium]|nr:hypothetical protein [Candidatus Paceibacterota bacterium]